MSSYTSTDFRRDWAYAIERDFHSRDGTIPARWAAGQPVEWGGEHAKIPLPKGPGAASLNADASLLAIALETDIHLYSISDLSLYQVLKGHTPYVDALCFHPKDARTLVSGASYDRHGYEKPEIILWHIDEERQRTLLGPDAIHNLGKRAIDSIMEGLASNPSSSWQMSLEDQSVLAKDVEGLITTLNIKSQLRTKTPISGCLPNQFGAHVFNSTGSSLAFMAGPLPPWDCDNKWDICIYDLPTNSVRLTLSGHRDRVVWVGFSPNDKLVASVSWDETFRIWDHGTGDLLHTFRSETQNLNGAFSPDSRFFAGTGSLGRVWVWDVLHGLEVAAHEVSVGLLHRNLDWSPDAKRLVIGSGRCGGVEVFDLKSQSVVQKRVLSMGNGPELQQQWGSPMLGIYGVRYVDEGRKIVFKYACDDGLEVYDFLENRKWRFAPAQGLDRGYSTVGFVVLEEKGMIASVDGDAVRFWKVPFGKKE